MSLTFMTGCDRGHRNPELNPGETENPENEELTAEDQKNKLMDVASEFIGVFNTADQKDAVEAFDWIVYNYMDYSWDGVDEYYSGVLDDIMNMAARTARSLSEGDFTANAAPFDCRGETVVVIPEKCHTGNNAFHTVGVDAVSFDSINIRSSEFSSCKKTDSIARNDIGWVRE